MAQDLYAAARAYTQERAPAAPQDDSDILDLSSLSREQALTIRKGQRIRLPDGTVTTAGGDATLGAGDTQVSENVFTAQGQPEAVAEDIYAVVRENPTNQSRLKAASVAAKRIESGDGLSSGGGAYVGGMLANFNDELAGLAAGGGQLASNAVRRVTGQPIEINAYDMRSAMTEGVRAESQRFAEAEPGYNMAAQFAGAITTGGVGGGRLAAMGASRAAALGAGNTALASNIGARAVGYGARLGAGYGVVSGAGVGEGGVVERAPGAALSGAFGSLVGGAGVAGSQMAAPIVQPIVQRVAGIAGIGRRTPDPAVAARVADFEQVGIEPTLAGVGRPMTQRVGAALAGNFMTGGPIARASARSRDQTIAAVDDIASRYGAAEGRESAGMTLRRGSKDAAQRLKDENGVLYDPINDLQQRTTQVVSDAGPVRPQTIPLASAQTAIRENLSIFQTPALRDWFVKKATDLSSFQDVLTRADGQVTLAEARQLRTLVGKMLDDPEVFRSQSQAGLNRMYAALSDDIANGARQLGGDDAANALSRADTYYQASRTRADDVLQQFYGTDTPAAAYNRLITLAKTNGNRSSWQTVRQLRDSMTPQEWGDVGAGVIRDLGQKNGNFSVAHFATQWDNLTPQARRVLFGGRGREDVFSDLQALARVARAQSDAGSFYNYSESGNTGGNVAGLLGLGGGGTAAMAGNPVPLALILSGGAFGNGLARLLTKPGVARWAAGATRNAVRDGDQIARRDQDFGRWWASNRNAIAQAVAQNDNAVLAPLSAAADPEQGSQP